jgi:hypothetical protein
MNSVPLEIQKMTCADINADIERLAQQDGYLDEQIRRHRGKNQTAGYIAATLFLPVILATESNNRTKGLLDQNQIRRDHLVVAFRGKHCPMTN